MSTTHHMCLSVRGTIARGFRDKRYFRDCLKWITRDDGSRYRNTDELLDALLDLIAKGHEVIPMTREVCEGFDYSGKGCPGHEEPIANLIARSSIGAGLRNIEANGIDAELADLDEEMHGR